MKRIGFIMNEIWHTFRDIRYTLNFMRLRNEYMPILRNTKVRDYLTKLTVLLSVKNVPGGVHPGWKA